MDFNKSIISGRLTRDPEIRTAQQTGNTICRFSIASNRTHRKKDGESVNNETVFVDCVAFGKTGEIIGDFFHKAKPILVEGRLHFAQWNDKQTGDPKNKLEIIVDSFVFIDGNSRDDRDEQPTEQAPRTSPIDDEDVPF